MRQALAIPPAPSPGMTLAENVLPVATNAGALWMTGLAGWFL
jgi:hypothetical protein